MNRDQVMQLPELKNFKGKEDIVKVCSNGNELAVLARGSLHLHYDGKWHEYEPHNLEDFVMDGYRALALDSAGFLLSQTNLVDRYSLRCLTPFNFVQTVEEVRFVKIAIGGDRFFAMAQDGGFYEYSLKNIRSVRYELDWSLYDMCDSEPVNQKVTQLLRTTECPMVLSSCGKMFIPEDPAVDKNIWSTTHKKLQMFGNNVKGKKVVELAVGMMFSFALTISGELYTWSVPFVYKNKSPQMIDYKCHAHQSRGRKIWASNTKNLVLVLLESGSFVSVKLTRDGEVDTKSIFSSIIHNFKAFKVHGCLYNGVRKLRSTGIKDMWMGKLEAIFDQEDASDLIMEAEGKPIHCHKSFVAAHCEYLKNWIKNEDVKENAGEKLRLCSKDLKYESLHTILKYFYTGRLEFHSFNITLNLIEVTDMWVEKEMQKLFVDQVIQHLSIENARFAKKIADKLEIEVLKEACISHNPDLYFVKF